MKQVLQNLRNGSSEIADVPSPALRAGHLLIRSSRSLVSTGTEKTVVEFGKAGWIGKAMQQPSRVQSVIEKVKTDGILPTLDAVRNSLDQPLALGYSNVGVVLAVGEGVTGFAPGDRVVSNGKHAEVVSVPVNLCAKVPASVSDEEAAFAVIGAIALQGIRLVQPTLGEAVVVTGLGLIGLVTVQLLRANGCRVLGVDFDPDRLAFAREFGAEVVNLNDEDAVRAANAFSRGRGVDAVLITAATTSNEPVHQAALMCRKRGRIVLVGVAGLELSRADFYEKELTFQVSCSYGPGRYDPQYEEKGVDYPVGFVRWTEQRNLEAVLDMMAARSLQVRPLISHRFAVDAASEAYSLISSDAPSLGVLLQYPARDTKPDAELRSQTVKIPQSDPRASAPVSGGVETVFIGAGNYASAVLMKAFKSAGATLLSVASNTGLTGMIAGRRFGFQESTTDTEGLIADTRVKAVVIATRHNTHASLTAKALAAGKHVFVEKPLALTNDEVASVETALREAPGKILTVGFNRRFAPHVQKMHELLRGVREQKVFVMTVNAGAIPASHWTQDASVGGGRIVGECCHFIDLLRFLAGSPVAGFEASSLGEGNSDRATITLKFEDGSLGVILYLANGHKSFPKERLEVFAGGRILQLDNFRKLRAFGWTGFNSMSLWRQDKGQAACAAAFITAIRTGGTPPIPVSEIMEVSRLSIDIAEALR